MNEKKRNIEDINKLKRTEQKIKKTRETIKWLEIIIVIIFVVMSLALIRYKDEFRVFLTVEIYRYGLVGLFLVNFFLEFIPQFIAPATTFIPALFAGIGIHYIVFSVVFGSFFGSYCGYFVGRKYGFNFLKWIIDDNKLDKTIKFMDKYGRLAILIAAISPVPYIPVLIGALNINPKNFALFGLLPRALGLSILGYLFYMGLL